MVINSIQTNNIFSFNFKLIGSFFLMNINFVVDEKPISGQENKFRLINIDLKELVI